MLSKKDISLNDYKKKYGKYTKLRKVSKLEASKNPSTLFKSRWCLIDNTYYEIPKVFTWTWFKTLHLGIQIGACVLLAGGIVTAVTVPLVINSKNNAHDIKRKVEVNDEQWKEAFTYLEQENVDNRNFTFIIKNKTGAVVDSTQEFYVNATKEKHYSSAQEETKYTKRDGTNYYLYNNNLKKWTSKLDNNRFEFDEPSRLSNLNYYKNEKNLFTFKDGYYTRRGDVDTYTLEFGMIDSKPRLFLIKHEESSGEELSTTEQSFTNYESTNISNFPND